MIELAHYIIEVIAQLYSTGTAIQMCQIIIGHMKTFFQQSLVYRRECAEECRTPDPSAALCGTTTVACLLLQKKS